MFKLVVLSVIIAVVAARPGYLEPVHHHYAEPQVIIAEPEYEYAKVGAIVDHVPSAVSHQSQTQWHSKPVIKTIVAPVIQKTIAYAAPIHHHKSYYAAEPVYSYGGHDLSYAHSYASPYSHGWESPIGKSYSW